MNEPVLCYIEGSRAFFTTQDLDKQWGDDWDDAPYEHNAGWPYEAKGIDRDRGEAWEITELLFDSVPLETPDQNTSNNWSVERINAKEIPWLQTSSWMVRNWHAGDVKRVWAGTTLSEFKKTIKKMNGRIFVEES